MLISGSPKVGGAILVVSAVDGVTFETERRFALASQTGVPAVVAFLNKAELLKDPELIEICQWRFEKCCRLMAMRKPNPQ